MPLLCVACRSLLSLLSSTCRLSHRLLLLLTSLVCLPPLCIAYRSMLSLVLSASSRSPRLPPLLAYRKYRRSA